MWVKSQTDSQDFRDKGGVGAWLARLEARGLARTFFVMAATLALIAVLLASGAPPCLEL
jgi:hypothetical protein